MLLKALCSISYPLVNSNWSYSPETPNLGQIRQFLAPCDLELWPMTLKNNRAPLLSNIKLYISFHHHMWIQTGVTVRKQLSWVVTSVTLTFDLWTWPFAWTLLLSLVITPENFMMIRWWEHSQQANLRDLIAATGQVFSNWIQIVNFSALVTVKFDGWPRKKIGHFFYNTSSFVHYFKSIGEFKLDLQSRNAQFGSKLVTCYLVWPWNLMDDLGKQ